MGWMKKSAVFAMFGPYDTCVKLNGPLGYWHLLHDFGTFMSYIYPY